QRQAPVAVRPVEPLAAVIKAPALGQPRGAAVLAEVVREARLGAGRGRGRAIVWKVERLRVVASGQDRGGEQDRTAAEAHARGYYPSDGWASQADHRGHRACHRRRRRRRRGMGRRPAPREPARSRPRAQRDPGRPQRTGVADDAQQVSLGQAALLAALAHAPSRDNPLVGPDRAGARRAVALARMVALGYATRDDAGRAAEEPLLATTRTGPFFAPHFTTRVLQWAEDSAVTSVGEWRTTLDLGLQTELEAEVRHTVDVLKDRLVAHAAVVVL